MNKRTFTQFMSRKGMRDDHIEDTFRYNMLFNIKFIITGSCANELMVYFKNILTSL